MPEPERGNAPMGFARAPEAIALFNTVFTSELLVHACWSKAEADGTGLEWPTVFLVLPLALHPPTRQSLPTQRRVTLARWAVRHPDLLADIEPRVANMSEPTKRAVRHGVRVGRLGFDGARLVSLKRPQPPGSAWPDELKLSARAARLCGQWFGVTEAHMAFDLLGIGG